MLGKWFLFDSSLLIVATIALVFLVIGYAVPDWVFLTETGLTNSKDHEFHISIWYNRLCPSTWQSCVTSNSHGDEIYQEVKDLNDAAFRNFTSRVRNAMLQDEEWGLWQSCSTASIILAILGFLLVLFLMWSFQIHRNKYCRVFACIGCFLMLASSTLMWVPVIMLAQINYNLDNLVRATFKLGLPSGLILAAIGAFFALIGGLLFLLYPCRPGSVHKQIKLQRPTPEPTLLSYTKDSEYVYGRQPLYYIERSPVEYIERPVSYIERHGVEYIERPLYGYLASPIVEYRSVGNNHFPLLSIEEYRPSSYLTPIVGGEYYPSRYSSNQDLYNDKHKNLLSVGHESLS